MNFQDSKFTKGSYKRGRARSNRNWRGGGRDRNWRPPQQWHKEQFFSNSRKNFSPNGIYKFGNEFSPHSSSYGILNQNIQLSVQTKKEHIRPKSPFPGSEEYTQRNIEKASDFIKRQLEIDENASAKTNIHSSNIQENLINDSIEFPKHTDSNNITSYSTKSDKVEKCSDNDHNSVYSPKLNFNTSSHQKIKLQQVYDVNEIHSKLINHISNLSHAKKVNIINQVGPTGYDLAVQQIQKQKRIELSHALREMCKEQCFNEKTEAINSIIPDFDIPIESLPKEIIQKLSTSLDVNFDDNNFSLSNIKQTSDDHVEFPRSDFGVPDPIVPETYFQQAEDLLKDSLEYLPNCEQFKTDLFLEQNLDNNDKFLQETATLNESPSYENLPDFKEFYQPSPQGSDVDQSNFQEDNVALPCPFNDLSSNLKENINFQSNQYEEMIEKDLTLSDFIGKQNQNTNARIKTNIGRSIAGHVNSSSDINMNIEQNQQQFHSIEYDDVLQNKSANKMEGTAKQFTELQLTDNKTKKDQVKFKPEKVHFEIKSRQKLFNRTFSEQTPKSKSKEVDNSILNVKTYKSNSTEKAEETTEHLQKQPMQNDVDLKKTFKGKWSKKSDQINNNNKLDNKAVSNADSDYSVNNDLTGKHTECTSTTALITNKPNDLELEKDVTSDVTKVLVQKNKISLNRDSYKETIKIINETDNYKYFSNSPPVKSNDGVSFSCLTKNFNPYTSYLKPTKVHSEQNREQANQKGSHSKIAKEDLAIEEIVKGFSPKKKTQEIANTQLIKFKGIKDESGDFIAITVKEKKSRNKRRDKRKNKRAKERDAIKYASNELEEELLWTAYNEMENDDIHADNLPTSSKGTDSNSCSENFTNIDKVLESPLINNTETTSGRTVFGCDTLGKNLESNCSQSSKGNDKILSNESTIQSIYEYENEDLDYDYDMYFDANKPIVKGADLKDDEMVRLWEKRAKDVHSVEKVVLEDGKLWNNFVEKSGGNVTKSCKGDGFTENDATLNFNKASEIMSENVRKNRPEEESSSMESMRNEILLVKDCDTNDPISNDIPEKVNIETNANLSENIENDVDTIRANTNLVGTDKNVKPETVLVENEASLEGDKKDILETGRLQIENEHTSGNKNSDEIQTKQKHHRSSSRESCKSSNKECKLKIPATKENTEHKTHYTHKTSLNQSESSKKGDETSEESANLNKEAFIFKKVKLQNKSHQTSDERKRKIRVRNNYSQTEQYAMKDIEVQTENNRKEYNDQIVQCETYSSIQNIKNQFPSAGSDGINVNSKLTRNDAITKLIEIDRQIDNLLKARQDFYKVLYNDIHMKVHSKLPNASDEMNIVNIESNKFLVRKSKNLPEKSPLKMHSTKRRKIKNGIKIGKNNKNINIKETESLCLQDSTVISPNDYEKLDIIEHNKLSSNTKDNLELNKNKTFENTSHNDGVNMANVEHGNHPFKRERNVGFTSELSEVRKNREINEGPNNNVISAVNKDSLVVASKTEQENVSLVMEKKNVVCDVFNVKRCNNKRNQTVRDKIQNTEENQIIMNQEPSRPAKRRKGKDSSFVTNHDSIKSLRQTNSKTTLEVTSSNKNSQNTPKSLKKRIAEENDEGINKENRLVPKFQNISHISEMNVENEHNQICSIDEPDHKRKRKDKSETASLETNVDKQSNLKQNSSKESATEKVVTRGLEAEETVIDNEKCENGNNLYKEIQKRKCIVRVERLSLKQVVLQNTNTSQIPNQWLNSNINNEIEHIPQVSEQKEDEKKRVYATKTSDFNQTALKQSTNELNNQLHLKTLNEEYVTDTKLSVNDKNMESENLQDLTCYNPRVEQGEECLEFLPCGESKVDLNCNQNLKMEQKMTSKGDPENIRISTSDVGGVLDEIFFENFEGVILVIKVVSGVIIAASDKGKLFCYSMSSGLLLHTINVCSVAITSLCVLKNNKEEEVLYTGSLDVKLSIYNFITKEKIKSENIGEPIQCMEYAWDYLFIGSDRGSIIRYDVQKEKIDYKEKIFDLNVLVLRATQEGTRKVLVVAARNHPVSVRDAMSGLLMRTMETPFCPTVYTLLLEKNFVFCGTSQHDILVYTFEDGQLIFKHEATKSKGVVCMQIVKNLLFAGCYNGNVYIYNIKTNKHLGTMTGPGGLLLSMEIVNGKIIVGTKSNKFKLWTVPNHYLAENENIT